MYALYTKSLSGITISWFATQEDCLKYIQLGRVSKYRYVQASKQKPLYFSQAFEWSEELQDVIVNIDKAKEIKLNEIRVLRNSYFDKADRIFSKALETDDEDKKALAISLKQKLRDITDLPLPNDENLLLSFVPEVFQEMDLIVI